MKIEVSYDTMWEFISVAAMVCSKARNFIAPENWIKKSAVNRIIFGIHFVRMGHQAPLHLSYLGHTTTSTGLVGVDACLITLGSL